MALKSLDELKSDDALHEFIEDAVARTGRSAGVAAAERGFGGNTGVQGHDGDSEFNVDAWFDNARWE